MCIIEIPFLIHIQNACLLAYMHISFISYIYPYHHHNQFSFRVYFKPTLFSVIRVCYRYCSSRYCSSLAFLQLNHLTFSPFPSLVSYILRVLVNATSCLANIPASVVVITLQSILLVRNEGVSLVK